MRGRTLPVALLLVFVAASCGEGGGDTRDLRRAIDRTQSEPYAYVYTETADGREVEVEVTVQDSFRSRTAVSLDGVELLDQVVVDDAAAVRLRAPDRWNPAAGTPLAEILGTGDWVVDPAGAPELLLGEESTGDITEVGQDPVLDAINALDYAQAAADQASLVAKFNKNSTDYRPSEDPFRDLVEADERQGLLRYDAIPPALPRTSEGQRGAEQIPGTQSFRRLSVYLKEGRVVRVLEQIDFESHPEIVKAVERRRPQFLLDVLEALREGIGDDPVRPRRMSVEVEPPDRNLRIELPTGARTANIGELLESDVLRELPDPAKLKNQA